MPYALPFPDKGRTALLWRPPAVGAGTVCAWSATIAAATLPATASGIAVAARSSTSSRATENSRKWSRWAPPAEVSPHARCGS